jgi:MAF protein/D-tyrosyl-tRNA(Tyr) deacylase
MIAVVQRVSRAEVRIRDREPARIDNGLLILLGVARGDSTVDAQWLAKKCLSLRIFNDDDFHMNRSLDDVGGAVLAVSQFTLLGDCIKGRRPSWSRAADPGEAQQLYEHFVFCLRRSPHPVETGVFQAMMEVDSVNDGPVTLIIDSSDWKGRATATSSVRGADHLLGIEQEPFYLASKSPRRSRLLEMLGVRFEVRRPAEDHAHWQPGDDPGRYAMFQAETKALSVSRKLGKGVVLGADTVVYLDKQVLEKPADAAEAAEFLTRLAGREHEVYTGISLARGGSETRLAAAERTRVRMSPLCSQEISDYIATGEPMDKAGAYGIQGVGGMLIEAIEGCYFNVMGLPLAKLRQLMQELPKEPRHDSDH